MPIAVKLRCSECETTRNGELKPEEKEITCDACGRRMQNLGTTEYGEIENAQKKQQIFSIVSLVFTVIAVVCVIMWAGDSGLWPSSDKQEQAAGGAFIAACVCALAALVTGILGSLKRFVVEF